MLRLTKTTRRLAAVTGIVAAAAGVAGCGGSGQTTTSTAQSAGGQLTVLAAASLSKALPEIDAGPRYTFAGSGTLETEIEQGAPADVFAAASPKQPAALYKAGLVYRPVPLATNTLVMIVPQDNPAHIASVAGVTRKGVRIVVCDPSEPCGDYAATAFANLGITAAADRNIVSEETDVTQVVAQIAAGQGDVGFVYITDAKAANGKVTAIRLPPQAKPLATDTIAVVKSTKNLPAARAFVALALSPQGQAVLKAAGFGMP